MAFTPFIANDCFVSVNGVDLSENAFEIDLHLEKDKVDASGFSATSTKTFLPGQKDEELTVSFRQDFSANRVDQTLFPLYDSGSAFPVIVGRAISGASATAPRFSGTATLLEYHPLDVSVGEVAETQVTFAFSSAVTRGTA